MLRHTIYLVFAILLSGSAIPPQTEAEEYNVKAAFIYNFTKYVEWEKPASQNEFVIGIAGPSPLIRPLNEIARTKTANGKKILVRELNAESDFSGCDIIFISRSSPVPLKSILEKTSGKGILTISEQAGFAKEGTAFNFVLPDNRVRFEANTRTLDEEGLKASSQLLKLAILVD